MFNIIREPFLYLIVYVLRVSICEQLLSNYVVSEDLSSQEDISFIQPVLVSVQGHLYEYQNFTRDESEDFRKALQTNFRRSCTDGNCNGKRPPLPAKRRARAYPVMMHCRGLLAYCKKECVDLSRNMCAEWAFLCPPAILSSIPDRCKIQCIHNLRQMRIKYPNQAKLPKDTNPRYDRFDYY